MNLDGAIAKLKSDFLSELGKQDPELQEALAGVEGKIFDPAGDAMIKSFVDTAVVGEDLNKQAINLVDTIATVCTAMNTAVPLLGLWHLNRFSAFVVSKFAKDDGEALKKISKLESTYKERLAEVKTKISKDDAENIQSTNDAVDGAPDISKPFHILLNKLLDQIKDSDPKVYENIHEHAINGKLPDHVESIIVATLQHIHALSEKNAPINNEEFVEKLRMHIESYDDANYLILGISNVAASYVMALENKAERLGGEFQDNFDKVVIPALHQLQDFAKEELLKSMGESNNGVELAINEIRQVNPEAASAIQGLINEDDLALVIIKAIESIVYEAHEKDVTDKLDKFIHTSLSLFKNGRTNFSIIFGFMPSAFGRLQPAEDEAEQNRIDQLVQKLYEFGEKLSEADESPVADKSTHIQQVAPTNVEKVKSDAFPWLTYSGFNYQLAVQIANESFKDDFVAKLEKYKNDFNTPEHKASIESHFGQFACAICMGVVNKYKAWANGDVAEKHVQECLNAYQELALYVAEDKDKSSENHVARLAFLGALLAYTNKNMPEAGKKTKQKVEAVADLITQTLSKKGVQLKATKSTNLFGMIETLLGTK